MRKRNKENRGLPNRWRLIHGAYYYRVPPGLESKWDNKKVFRLGAKLPEAYKVWADRIQYQTDARTVADLLERYQIQVVPTKAPKTQSENRYSIRRVIAGMGHFKLTDIKPQTIYQYVENRTAKVRARHEMAVLSHAFTKAVQWGIIEKHPFKGNVTLELATPRTRYIEDWEVIEVLSLKSKRSKGSLNAIGAYIRLKLLTGMSRGDLLRLTMSQIKEDGIHIQRNKTKKKTGKKTIYKWSEELRATVEMAKAARPVDISAYLFCNRRGQSYMNELTGEASGWDSMWQRFMVRVMNETKVEERFTEHDLRAKAGSDAETLEHARALLSHADSRTTASVYRRKAESVMPLR